MWAALLGVLKQRFDPPVWHVILDDTVVERATTKAPECRRHFNHSAKPNRPRFINGQGWVCLAAVVERAGKVGAVPLMLRLVRAKGNRGKHCPACLGSRLFRRPALAESLTMYSLITLWAASLFDRDSRPRRAA